MIEEKAGDEFGWKNKLEQMENLPHEKFNKEAAWGKLHERIQGRPRDKKAVWYWMAAACLILALIVPWLFLANKKENILVKNSQAPKQNPSSTKFIPLRNKDTNIVISSLPVEKKPLLQFNKRGNKANPASIGKINKIEINAGKIQKQEYIKSAIAATATVLVDTSISIAVNLPEKKKLKVVHINELSDPEPVIIVKAYERHSFLVKFINHQLDKNPPSSGNTGFNIFKTTPPSN